MNTLQIILLLVVLIFLAMLVLGILHYFRQKTGFRKNSLLQAKRDPFSNAEFCERLSLNVKDAALVSEIREGLAKRGSYNPDHIYPEDELWKTFDFQLGDFLDEFAMNYIPCKYGELPYEELSSVGSFVKFLVARHEVLEAKCN